jgi:hypothetical protein
MAIDQKARQKSASQKHCQKPQKITPAQNVAVVLIVAFEFLGPRDDKGSVAQAARDALLF